MLNYKRLAIFSTLSLLSLSLGALPSVASGRSGVRQGFPGRRMGGGVRVPQAACISNRDSLVALMPETNFALTTKANPTLWFYLPERDASKALELRLFSQENKLVYKTVLPAADQSGIVGVNLPDDDTMGPLNIGENYRWRLSIVCNPTMRAQDIYVEGWVRRVELDSAFASQLSNAQPIDHSVLYQQAGIWYDALTSHAALQLSQPDDTFVTTQWNQLLETVGLEQLGVSAQSRISQIMPIQSPTELSRVSN